LQERKKKTTNSSAGDLRISSPTLTSNSRPPSPQEELEAKVLEVINLIRKGVQDDLEKLQGTCLNLENEVIAVTSRRDLMEKELGREREWIRLLEITLKTHAIPFPPYPCNS
jgi:hypothetical protein